MLVNRCRRIAWTSKFVLSTSKYNQFRPYAIHILSAAFPKKLDLDQFRGFIRIKTELCCRLVQYRKDDMTEYQSNEGIDSVHMMFDINGYTLRDRFEGGIPG